VGVLKALGAKKALLFCGPDGLDELGLSGVSLISELSEDGKVRDYTFDPKRFFGATRPLAAISGGTPEINAAITRRIITGEERGAYRDAAALNASAAIVAAGIADSLETGIDLAYNSIDSGEALKKLQALTAPKAPKPHKAATT
jgi:anthranilate phosphoribosyltransferase